MRILRTLARGESDPEKLAELAANNLKASREQMADALSGPMPALYQRVLSLPLEELDWIDRHIGELERELETALTEHHATVRRLCEMPGIREDRAESGGIS